MHPHSSHPLPAHLGKYLGDRMVWCLEGPGEAPTLVDRHIRPGVSADEKAPDLPAKLGMPA